ncbi:MAG: hypothetical protein WCA92_03890 [Terriglobales bacterium]
MAIPFHKGYMVNTSLFQAQCLTPTASTQFKRRQSFHFQDAPYITRSTSANRYPISLAKTHQGTYFPLAAHSSPVLASVGTFESIQASAAFAFGWRSAFRAAIKTLPLNPALRR